MDSPLFRSWAVKFSKVSCLFILLARAHVENNFLPDVKTTYRFPIKDPIFKCFFEGGFVIRMDLNWLTSGLLPENYPEDTLITVEIIYPINH